MWREQDWKVACPKNRRFLSLYHRILLFFLVAVAPSMVRGKVPSQLPCSRHQTSNRKRMTEGDLRFLFLSALKLLGVEISFRWASADGWSCDNVELPVLESSRAEQHNALLMLSWRQVEGPASLGWAAGREDMGFLQKGQKPNWNEQNCDLIRY